MVHDFKKEKCRRKSAENILHTRGGATTFIKQRIDNAKDVFFELLGQETIQKIHAHTIAEALWKDDKNFDVSTEELCAFLRLCLIRGFLKGKKSATFFHGLCNFKFTHGYSPFR